MPEKQYNPQAIEEKWQRVWEEQDLYRAEPDSKRPKYYVLEMLPYPSGALHMGHMRNYAIGDALARYKWMRGYNVMHPMGWDAFGLPAENAAIKNNTHPRKWTLDNIAHMKEQHRRFGFAYDWSKEVSTCEPEYYRWNQWFFLKLYERGLAYRKKSLVNWCPECQTVLANEQVVEGCCWRHETTRVESRELEQWFLRITQYSDQLLDDIAKLKRWPEKVLTMQRNWIGRSQGARVRFAVEGLETGIEIFTTRMDTIYGATALVLAPEHPQVEAVLGTAPWSVGMRAQVRRMIDGRAGADPGQMEKEGFFTGRLAINPFNQERVPIWVANFVLMEYGTGAIMSVPAHDQRDYEFAKKYHLEIRPVIVPVEGSAVSVQGGRDGAGSAFTAHGRLVNSGPFTGLTSEEAVARMTAHAEENGFGKDSIIYRLKDWGISRQRYWGTPIPILYCAKCGTVPVPESQLPVVLPLDVKITGMGHSPLKDVPEFLHATCPKCGGPADRETDTMDTFVDSSWYFYRYVNPKETSGPIDRKAVEYWFPVEQYIGGVEHAILHLIYSRFWTKLMRDLGLVKLDEPVERLFSQGMVIKEGRKMSKSFGNVVDADEMRTRHGADTARMYTLFAAPPAKDMDWSDAGVEGIVRFVNRVYRYVTRNADRVRPAAPVSDGPRGDGGYWPQPQSTADRDVQRRVHQTTRRLTTDFEERWRFNTSISAIMELVNDLTTQEGQISAPILREALDTLALLLAPLAPHLAQELWAELGHDTMILRESWPSYDPALTVADEVEVVIQVNGRPRSKIMAATGLPRQELAKLAHAEPRIAQLVAGKMVLKTVVVPDKLVNIVVQE